MSLLICELLKKIWRRMQGPKFWPICNDILEMISSPKTVTGKTDYYDFISIQSKSLKPWNRRHFSTLHQHSGTLLSCVGVCVHIHSGVKLMKGKSLITVCVRGFINVILLGALRSCSLCFCAKSTVFYTHFLATWPLTQDPPNPPTTKGSMDLRLGVKSKKWWERFWHCRVTSYL